MLFKLAGSACSGKTTVARACPELADVVVHDFDEIGVPSGADTRWRQHALERWIERSVRYQREGLSVLLTGQSPLGEVLACPSAALLEGIAVCLLDVDDAERIARLERRDPARWSDSAKEAFLGWARWHREHALDPQARPEVITTGGWEQMRWDRWREWSSADVRWRTTVVCTTGCRVEQSVRAVCDWIVATQRLLEDGRLSLAAGWD